jgi:hypothetical protein
LPGEEPPFLVALGDLARVRGDLVAKALEQRAHARGELLAVAGVVGHGKRRAGRASYRHHGLEARVVDRFFEALAQLGVDEAQQVARRTGRRTERHQPST